MPTVAAPQAKQAHTPTPNTAKYGSKCWCTDCAWKDSHDTLVVALREIADPRSPKGTAQMRNIAQAALAAADKP